ncbi:SDR family NAD(P)-dependent oxidoreductase [Streptomyces sp. NPDC055140]
MSESTSRSPLRGKVAIVSGAARGIGAATASRLVADGARVVIGDVLEGPGRSLAADLAPHARYVRLDVTDPDDWRAAVEVTQDTFGSPDILVCNAGIMLSGPLEKTTPDDFRRTFETNAIGVLQGIQAVTGPMRANGGGSVVVLSSVAGAVGIEGLSAYCTSKAANAMIARCAAIELSPYNIRVNSVHPGKVDTPMSSGAVAVVGEAAAADLPPLGRVGQPEDVAALIAFLAGDDASYLTGDQHFVDGGRHAGVQYTKPVVRGTGPGTGIRPGR